MKKHVTELELAVGRYSEKISLQKIKTTPTYPQHVKLNVALKIAAIVLQYLWQNEQDVEFGI